MNYEEMIRETDRMIRGIMIRSAIAECILFALVAIVAVLMIRLWWAERKARKAQKVVGGEVFSPVVTEVTQMVDGVEFHRMGVPGRRCE